MSRPTTDIVGDKLEELDWIKLRQDMNSVGFMQETFGEKAKRKFRENPFIPIGCLLTTGALSYGLWSFRKGNVKMSQNMMRLRVLAQGFTIVAFIVGIGAAATAKR